MQLSLQHRHVGYVTVITCRGRLVMGEEADALLKRIDDLLPINSRILLHLGEVDFIDSGGLGLLVRCLTRVQNAAGQLSICALSPKVSDVLRITKLDSVLKPYYAEADAIASAHSEPPAGDNRTGALVLCADSSPDVLAYLRGLLKSAGLRVVTAENLHDGLILLKTMRPTVVVIGAELHAKRGTASAEEFQRRVPPNGLIVLPAGFSSRDAGEAAGVLMRDIAAKLN
ncbi:MAG TPA: anti-sigma factor antagonist [Vicinamibacterales bacterium]|nr:anti-sigma factor antagonist [Vicinamibacterales bacterium]